MIFRRLTLYFIILYLYPLLTKAGFVTKIFYIQEKGCFLCQNKIKHNGIQFFSPENLNGISVLACLLSNRELVFVNKFSKSTPSSICQRFAYLMFNLVENNRG